MLFLSNPVLVRRNYYTCVVGNLLFQVLTLNYSFGNRWCSFSINISAAIKRRLRYHCPHVYVGLLWFGKNIIMNKIMNKMGRVYCCKCTFIVPTMYDTRSSRYSSVIQSNNPTITFWPIEAYF